MPASKRTKRPARTHASKAPQTTRRPKTSPKTQPKASPRRRTTTQRVGKPWAPWVVIALRQRDRTIAQSAHIPVPVLAKFRRGRAQLSSKSWARLWGHYIRRELKRLRSHGINSAVAREQIHGCGAQTPQLIEDTVKVYDKYARIIARGNKKKLAWIRRGMAKSSLRYDEWDAYILHRQSQNWNPKTAGVRNFRPYETSPPPKEKWDSPSRRAAAEDYVNLVKTTGHAEIPVDLFGLVFLHLPAGAVSTTQGDRIIVNYEVPQTEDEDEDEEVSDEEADDFDW